MIQAALNRLRIATRRSKTKEVTDRTTIDHNQIPVSRQRALSGVSYGDFETSGPDRQRQGTNPRGVCQALSSLSCRTNRRPAFDAVR